MDKVMSTTSCATTTTDQQNVSISINGQSRVPPGFRFHPTEEELLQYYLRKKVGSLKIDLDVIVEVDLNKLEPWDIQEKCKIGSTPQNEWYFFSHKDKKYPTGTRTNRATMAGFWKATGRDKVIYGSGKRIGMRKTLVFYKGRAPHGQKSDWIMHEYRLIEDYRSTSVTAAVNHETNIIAAAAAGAGGDNSAAQEEGWVVCKIFKKKHYPNKLSSSSAAAAATAAARNGILMSNGNNSPNNCSTMMTKNSIPAELTESYLSSDQDHDENHDGALEQIFQHINSKPSLPTKYSNGIIMDDVVVFNNNNREDHEDDEEEEDNLINHGFHKSTSFDDNFTSSMRLPNLESPNTNTNVGGNLGYDHNSYNHHLNVVELSNGSDKFGKEGSGVDDQLQQVSYTMGVDGFSDWGTIDQLLATNLITSHHHHHHHFFNQYNNKQQSLLSDHHQNLHNNLSGGYNTTTSVLTPSTLDHHQYHHHHRRDDEDNNQQSTTSSYFLQQQPGNHDSFLSGVSEIDHLWNLVSRSNPLVSTQPTAAAAAASSSDVLM